MVTVEGTPVPAFGFFFLHVHFKVRGCQFVSLTSMEIWVRETKGWQWVTLWTTLYFPYFLLHQIVCESLDDPLEGMCSGNPRVRGNSNPC